MKFYSAGHQSFETDFSSIPRIIVSETRKSTTQNEQTGEYVGVY